ncbi:polyadenylate-binding protein 2-like [Iris pallida]|uniref:Polyadenylate-binding protein 2-like n=1 Tax=Iris pallida TaxID=29817 RepID=A0AAX6ES30_IRIPA|nr:polyadenylate-binding protein 2-like [Iris pallida]KAJ6837683.1 polyadenylate-binding protein 2-like [Iris pallida]KAJ6853422.1 polyadenylate-binding protein 2-like [Iris pallida]
MFWKCLKIGSFKPKKQSCRKLECFLFFVFCSNYLLLIFFSLPDAWGEPISTCGSVGELIWYKCDWYAVGDGSD